MLNAVSFLKTLRATASQEAFCLLSNICPANRHRSSWNYPFSPHLLFLVKPPAPTTCPEADESPDREGGSHLLWKWIAFLKLASSIGKCSILDSRMIVPDFQAYVPSHQVLLARCVTPNKIWKGEVNLDSKISDTPIPYSWKTSPLHRGKWSYLSYSAFPWNHVSPVIFCNGYLTNLCGRLSYG